MKERGILFSAPMVRAILSGAKTQTRRLIMRDRAPVSGAFWGHAGWAPSVEDGCVRWRPAEGGEAFGPGSPELRAYAARGDRLWVRETHALHHAWDAKKAPPRRGSCRIWYRADDDGLTIDGRGKWRPSIFTKRWASRITLDVTDVRIERLQAITETDARAEGVEALGARQDFRGAFCALWDSINGDRADWESNPFVWVISFRRVD